jgi:hypothetical protein
MSIAERCSHFPLRFGYTILPIHLRIKDLGFVQEEIVSTFQKISSCEENETDS